MNAKYQSLLNNKEESEKCKDGLYLFNNYFRQEGVEPLTREEYDSFVKMVELHRNGKPLRGRTGKLYPMKPEECFQQLTV